MKPISPEGNFSVSNLMSPDPNNLPISQVLRPSNLDPEPYFKECHKKLKPTVPDFLETPSNGQVLIQLNRGYPLNNEPKQQNYLLKGNLSFEEQSHKAHSKEGNLGNEFFQELNSLSSSLQMYQKDLSETRSLSDHLNTELHNLRVSFSDHLKTYQGHINEITNEITLQGSRLDELLPKSPRNLTYLTHVIALAP